MSYLSQMLALVIHNFFSAAVGIAMAVALFRAGHLAGLDLGNFYVDITRATLYILIPLAIIGTHPAVTGRGAVDQ